MQSSKVLLDIGDGCPLVNVLRFRYDLPYAIIENQFPTLAAILVLGVVQIGITSILFSFAIKRISAIPANLITVIEPVFNPVWVFLLLGEAPGLRTLIGGVIIVAAVTGVSVYSARRKQAL